jgi:hypothetical protein
MANSPNQTNQTVAEHAQNAPAPVNTPSAPRINPPSSIAFSAADAAALQSAAAALPAYFDTTQDPVTDDITIKQRTLDDSGDSLQTEILVSLSPDKAMPDPIALHIVGTSDRARFDDDSDLTIRANFAGADPVKKDYGHLEDKQAILHDGTMLEQFICPLTMDDLHTWAWGDELWFKLGYKTEQIGYDERQKWKLLWQYLNLRARQMQSQRP